MILNSEVIKQLDKDTASKPKPRVGILMGLDSDLPTMKDATVVLDKLGVEYEFTLVSAHRTSQSLEEYARSAVARGLQVIIVGPGCGADSVGVVASVITLHVASVTTMHVVDARVVPSTLNVGLLAAQIIAKDDQRLHFKILANSQYASQYINHDKAINEERAFPPPAAKKASEMLLLFSSTAPVALPKPAPEVKEDARRTNSATGFSL